MKRVRHLQVVFYVCSIWLLTPGLASDTGNIRQRRNVYCSEKEYLHGNICCPNCPAGKHLKSPCTRSGERSHCEECNDGSFTEHPNALPLCLKCIACRHDQEVVRPCSLTQNAECQCKAGRFCDPDEPCEVCKKCSKCKDGEEAVRNCTSTTNTECKKTKTNPVPVSDYAALSVLVVLGALAVGAFCLFFIYKRRNETSNSQRADHMKSESIYIRTPDESGEEETRRPSGTNLSLSLPLVRPKPLAGVEEECKMLCESLNSSASNSQHSLTYLPPSFAAPTPAPQAPPAAPWRPDKREEVRFPKLMAVKGEDSLRACFGFFEDLSMDCHKRFFRLLGISDNVIKGKEHLTYEDRVHELLNIWVEKKGRDASLNDLLRALLELDQKYTAETIHQKALRDGHYLCEENMVF